MNLPRPKGSLRQGAEGVRKGFSDWGNGEVVGTLIIGENRLPLRTASNPSNATVDDAIALEIWRRGGAIARCRQIPFHQQFFPLSQGWGAMGDGSLRNGMASVRFATRLRSFADQRSWHCQARCVDRPVGLHADQGGTGISQANGKVEQHLALAWENNYLRGEDGVVQAAQEIGHQARPRPGKDFPSRIFDQTGQVDEGCIGVGDVAESLENLKGDGAIARIVN